MNLFLIISKTSTNSFGFGVGVGVDFYTLAEEAMHALHRVYPSTCTSSWRFMLSLHLPLMYDLENDIMRPGTDAQ